MSATAPSAAPRTSTRGEPLRSTRNHWMTWVETHALMRPDGVAFRFLGNDTTWAALRRRVADLASGLAGRGVGSGDRVLLLTLNRP